MAPEQSDADWNEQLMMTEARTEKSLWGWKEGTMVMVVWVLAEDELQ